MIMDSDLIKKIDKYIENHKVQIIADLRKVVEIPSVAGDAEGDAPYGIECLEILRESLRLFQNAGYSGRLAKSNKYAVMEYGKGNKTIVLSLGLNICTSLDTESTFAIIFRNDNMTPLAAPVVPEVYMIKDVSFSLYET